MVGRKHQHLRLLKHRPVLTQDAGNAQRQLLQPPQRAQRLGLVVYGVLHALGEGGIGQRGDGGNSGYSGSVGNSGNGAIVRVFCGCSGMRGGR